MKCKCLITERKTKRSRQSGVISIEFALGFFLFWLMVMAWAELSYMSYVSAVNDVAIAEASRSAKKGTQAYMDAFERQLKKDDSFWGGFMDKNQFRASVRYVQDINALTQVQTICLPPQGEQMAECGVAQNSAIAIYYVGYQFDSIFDYFIDTKEVFGREVIVVQEYERDQFNY
ncbi:pilus assembly protein [Vibrio sp. SM6]|uniref:Pilus assembly protein n=2 Tax=Vibrio agarilyticus TaxID=2726741 RepID=A0A7X8YGV8_9VIBR|nr:pilus assembly protein [Vibrio agarilyticus]